MRRYPLSRIIRNLKPLSASLGGSWHRLTARRLIAGVIAAFVFAVLPALPAHAAGYVGSAVRTDAEGYWLVAADGAVAVSGKAKRFGDMSGRKLNKSIVGMASTPSNGGYWLVASDGGIFAFGDAAFFGSTGSLKLNKPVVGMASTPSGRGYWLVASDGGIFAYGDAAFLGSTGAIALNKPVVGMSPTTDGKGYWLVATDGGIFAYGSAAFFGSTGSLKLNQPVMGMSTTSSGKGYWLAGEDGGVFSFGDARFLGAALSSSASRAVAIIRNNSGGYHVVRSDGSLETKDPERTTVTTPPPTSVTTSTTTTTLTGGGGSTTTTPPTTAPPSNPTTTSTTAAPPVSNLPGWTQIFSDDFNSNVGEGGFLGTYGSKWTAYPNGWKDTSKKGNYNPNILSVNNGVMNMRLHTSGGVPQVAAPEPKINGTNDLNQLYGRYEVRFRADPVDGYKTAWLLWPKSEVWPRDGEIDFPEGDLTGSMGAFMHRQGGTSGGDQDHFGSSARFADWHTAVIEWSPGRCAFIIDGNTIGVSTNRVPNTPMRWVLQTETELNSTYPPSGATGNVQIDYVKVWKYTP